MKKLVLVVILLFTALVSTGLAAAPVSIGIGVSDQLYSKLPEGLYVCEIDPSSPAEKAGLKVNDIILSINGKKASYTVLNEIKKTAVKGLETELVVARAKLSVNSDYKVTSVASWDILKIIVVWDEYKYEPVMNAKVDSYNESSATLRDGSGKILCSIPDGATVQFIRYSTSNNNFAYVSYKGKKGYVDTCILDPIAVTSAQTSINKLNAMTGKNFDSYLIGFLDNCVIAEKSNEYTIQIRSHHSKNAWWNLSSAKAAKMLNYIFRNMNQLQIYDYYWYSYDNEEFTPYPSIGFANAVVDSKKQLQIEYVNIPKLGLDTTSSKIKINKQPVNATAKAGEVVKTTVEATGKDLTYTWYIKNSSSAKFSKSSVTGSTYSFRLTEENSGRKVYCLITDANGNKALTDTVTLSITGQEAKETVPVTNNNVSNTPVVDKKLTTPTPKATAKKPTATPKPTPCAKCGGDGKITSKCSTCGGDGKKDRTCGMCDKYGKRDCRSCSAKGYVRCWTCSGKGRLQCFYCDGTGKIGRDTCWRCNGAGVYQKCNACKQSGYRACSSCDGYGYFICGTCKGLKTYTINCSDCNGKGKITKYCSKCKIDLKIIKQPTNATAKVGEVVETTVEATGNNLTYTWYVKNPSSTKFGKSSVTGSTYSCRMTKENSGRQVYCVITDVRGNSITTKTVTLKTP
ncbi:MAG: PDZ domain-containing protein [Clostridia bacterium]|nr:PDZ domain-containing protein [Clostridia bacterium]